MKGKNWLWAIGGILLIVTVYEINPKIGLGLFVLALLAMVYTYVRDPSFINPTRI